jgi:hypothetical protein
MLPPPPSHPLFFVKKNENIFKKGTLAASTSFASVFQMNQGK